MIIRAREAVIGGTSWLAWWYLTIGLGFVLLGTRLLLIGARPWLALLRFVVAAGFFLLAYVQFRAARRR